MAKKGAEKVQFNHNWDAEAFSPKDGQRYLVRIWSKMRTAFKDNSLSVYGMRVVEPHHDGTPHWHMMLFCERKQRQQIIDIMRRYALKEDGDERGAAKNRFEAKHLNKGGAASYIAKYIAKNIDGYALDGQIDHDTGKPLRDMTAAVTSWASTWRIPQFKAIGIPSMGAYRECRAACLRHISLTETFDERVEAVRAAASAENFAPTYMAGQGAQIFLATCRPCESRARWLMSRTLMTKRCKRLSAFLRRTLARVIFTKPGQQNGALSARPLTLMLIL